MISLFYKKNSKETETFLENLKKLHIYEILNKYGELGVQTLAAATPKDTGKTAYMWGYEIEEDSDGYTIYFTNDNFNKGVNIAVILQYGHGTGTGGYVEGIDYINPSMQPVFEGLADDAWREVTSK